GRGISGRELVSPNLFACRRIKRRYSSIGRTYVHYALHHERSIFRDEEACAATSKPAKALLRRLRYDRVATAVYGRSRTSGGSATSTRTSATVGPSWPSAP